MINKGKTNETKRNCETEDKKYTNTIGNGIHKQPKKREVLELFLS